MTNLYHYKIREIYKKRKRIHYDVSISYRDLYGEYKNLTFKVKFSIEVTYSNDETGCTGLHAWPIHNSAEISAT